MWQEESLGICNLRVAFKTNVFYFQGRNTGCILSCPLLLANTHPAEVAKLVTPWWGPVSEAVGCLHPTMKSV